MDKEGYIKFNCVWDKQEIEVPADIFASIRHWKEKLYALNLIGAYENGVGFGNISCRDGDSGRFFITGSATGGIRLLEKEHLALVTEFDIDRNTV